MSEEKELEGKVVVVTGGGRGIGAAIAGSCAREGARVGLVARTVEQLNTVAKNIDDAGADVTVIPTDVTDRRQTEAMAETVREYFGRIDILFNNAGGGTERRSIAESDPDEWTATVDLNLTSAYYVTHALLPLMIESGGGKIINTGSGMGHRPGDSGSAYRVGKAGMWMFTQCLAEEVWEHGITVNELIPGPVATYLTEGRMEVGGPPPFAPSEHVKGPEDVVPLAMWLATQPSTGPTAQTFSLTRRPI
tara:strand:- start:9388 stop:10134 length:747 start_codon:yes stop_codon:yes gene_type:complete